MLLALFNRLKVVLVAFASAKDELLASPRRAVVEVAREKCPAVARLGRLATAIGAFERVALGVDERHLALVARIGYADGIRMEGATGVQALVPAHHRLDARIGANGTEGTLFQHGTVGRAANRSAGEGVVDRLSVGVDAPAEFALALLASVVAFKCADGRRDGHHQRIGAALYNINIK